MTGTHHSFDTRACANITDLCASFSTQQLQSPTRSTVPLIDLVYHHRPTWERFLKMLGAPLGCMVSFELGVPSPKARGNPSQTDAVFASDSSVWAIEAKWTEPIDRQTVAKRISKPEADGGDPRVTVGGWLSHLQPLCPKPLRVGDFGEIIYQMVHRAASAAYLAQKRNLKPELVYLHFVPSPRSDSATTEHYVSELTRLHERLARTPTLPISVVEMPLEYTEAFDAIKDLDKRSPATSQKVKQALCAGPVFRFGEPAMIRI